MAIVFILLVIAILTIGSGDGAWYGTIIIIAFVFASIIGICVAIDDDDRAKKGKECYKNYLEYKKKNNL